MKTVLTSTFDTEGKLSSQEQATSIQEVLLTISNNPISQFYFRGSIFSKEDANHLIDIINTVKQYLPEETKA